MAQAAALVAGEALLWRSPLLSKSMLPAALIEEMFTIRSFTWRQSGFTHKSVYYQWPRLGNQQRLSCETQFRNTHRHNAPQPGQGTRLSVGLCLSKREQQEGDAPT